MRNVIRGLWNRGLPHDLFVVVVLVAVGVFQFIGWGTAEAVQESAYGTYVGSSCVIAPSNGATRLDGVSTGWIYLRCEWSQFDDTRPAGFRKEARPFANSCSDSADSGCVAYTPTSITFWEYSGSTSSSDPLLRHGSQDAAGRCNIGSFEVVDAPADGRGTWRFYCSSTTSVWHTKNVYFEYAVITDSTSTTWWSGVSKAGGLLVAGTTASPQWAGSLRWWPYTDWENAEPQFTWTQEVRFCGAEVTVTNETTGLDTFSDGDVLAFSTAWTSSRTEYVKATFPGGGGQWQIYTPGTLSNPYEMELTFSAGATHRAELFYLREITLTCLDNVLNQVFTLAVGAPVEDTGDGRPRPCELARFYWPQYQAVDSGQELVWHLNYAGTPTTAVVDTSISVEWSTWDDSGDNVPAFSSLTWIEVDGSPFELGTSEDVTASGGYDGSLRQFVWRCTDELGTVYAGQWASGIHVIGSGAASRPSCYQQTGIGLNPSSWVPGLVRMGACVVEDLFVPSEASTARLWGAADELTQHAPISYVADSYDAIDGAATGSGAAVAAHEDDCLSLWSQWPGDIEAPTSACPVDAGLGSLGTFRSIMAGLFWLGFAYGLFRSSVQVLFR